MQPLPGQNDKVSELLFVRLTETCFGYTRWANFNLKLNERVLRD